MLSSFGTITQMLQAFSSFWLCFWPSLAQLALIVQFHPHSKVAKVMGCYCVHVRGLLVAFMLCCEIWWHDVIRRENDFHGNLDYSYFRRRSILVPDPVDIGEGYTNEHCCFTL